MIGLYFFVVIAGVISTALSGANATMSKTLAQPMTAALIILLVNAVPVVGYGVARGGLAWPEAGKFAALPWWAWLGGFGGAIILIAQLFAAQKVGAAVFLGVTVTAGIVTSIAMDHFALVGFERNPAQIGRLIGGALMIGGVVLVARN